MEIENSIFSKRLHWKIKVYNNIKYSRTNCGGEIENRFYEWIANIYCALGDYIARIGTREMYIPRIETYCRYEAINWNGRW